MRWVSRLLLVALLVVLASAGFAVTATALGLAIAALAYVRARKKFR